MNRGAIAKVYQDDVVLRWHLVNANKLNFGWREFLIENLKAPHLPVTDHRPEIRAEEVVSLVPVGAREIEESLVENWRRLLLVELIESRFREGGNPEKIVLVCV